MESNGLTYGLRKYSWTLLPVILVAMVAGLSGGSSDFNFALWSIDYSQGFVRRGLAGEVVGGLFEVPLSKETMEAIFLFCFLLFVFASLLFFISFGSFPPFTLFVILSSGFYFQQYAYDLGKLDVIILMMVMIGLKIINPDRMKTTLVLIFFITTVALLIHEVSALLLVPIFLAGIWVQPLERVIRFKLVSAYFLYSILMFTVVYIAGSSTVEASVRYQSSSTLMPFLTADNDVFNIAGRSFYDNFSWAMGRLMEEKTGSRVLLNLVACFPFLIILGSMIRELMKLKVSVVEVVVLVSGSVLFLYFLGVDFYRWNAVLMSLLFILLAYVGGVVKITYSVPLWLVWIALVFSHWSGPLGISVALPSRFFLFSGLEGII